MLNLKQILFDTNRGIGLNKSSKDWIFQKSLVWWKLDQTFFLSTNKFPFHSTNEMVIRIDLQTSDTNSTIKLINGELV